MAFLPYRRRPVDWTCGAGRPRVAAPSAVDIVVPVYGAAAALRACLASVVRETDLRRHRLRVVVDGPQADDVEAVLEGYAVIRNERRLGFVAAANRGMRASERDVVLLNSDTVVTPGWLEQLVAAAYSDGDVGTVTPLSNNASLCSVPRGFAENLLPAGCDAAAFAALIARVSARRYPRLPTGVGFCLYVRRALLDDIGEFDQARFGLGYGEENDFCFRALERGWVHVADDATFVYHAGNASFGRSRAARQRQAQAALLRRHPRYLATIAAFMHADPLADTRERITRACADQPTPALVAAHRAPRRIVHVVHGWPPFQQAGTELYAWWLVRRQKATDHVAVYARAADPARAHADAVELLDRGVRVRLLNNVCMVRDPFRRNGLRDRAFERDFARFLREERPDLVHVHHLSGHAFSLAAIARRLRIPVVMQIQDWWFLCARANLYDRDGARCSGPAPAKCAACATLTRLAPAALTNRALHRARRAAARAALAAADAYVVGSRAISDDYVAAGMLDGAKPLHVIPYGVDVESSNRHAPAQRPIRFGYVGSITPHKGVHVAVEAIRTLDAAQASLHLWGNPDAHPAYVDGLRQRGGAVVFEGRFAEVDKPRVFGAIDVLLVPSIGLESFCLAAREAMACGVPLIASAGGALSEMFEAGACGELFPAGDAAALARIMQRVVEEPALIERWRERIVPPKHSAAHAEEIDRVYADVLGR